jgi:uncharacterized membrane protein
MAAGARLASIDIARGVAMILMALDHTRDFVGDRAISPTNLAQASAALFLTRWITHLCAPTFFLLTGTSAYLSARGRSTRDVSRHLVTRGLWLIVLEVVVLRALAWQFNLDFQLVLLNVLWALGWSMIALGALVFLPLPAIAAAGLLLIAGHNLFDGVRSANPLWTVLHSPNFILRPPGRSIFVAYPLIPWIGVTAVGYALGRVYEWPAERRRAFLVAAGAASIVWFIVLRAARAYGDPSPWRSQATGFHTVLSILNATKYPPSLQFLLMTLGPALLLLAWAEGEGGRGWKGRRGGKGWSLTGFAETIGQVPLFYFALHAALIHLVAIAICAAQYGAGSVHLMFESPTVADFPMTAPPGWGIRLPAVYAVWIGVVAALYPACRRYARVKQQRRSWVLRYM